MTYFAVILMILGIWVIKLALSDKTNKYNKTMIGNTSLVMYIVFIGLILFIIGGMLLNAKLGVYDCRWR